MKVLVIYNIKLQPTILFKVNVTKGTGWMGYQTIIYLGNVGGGANDSGMVFVTFWTVSLDGSIHFGSGWVDGLIRSIAKASTLKINATTEINFIFFQTLEIQTGFIVETAI
jgi:hypothetical protein